MELELRSVEPRGAHETGGCAQGVGAPPNLVDRVWAPGLDSFASIFLFSKSFLRGFSGHSENFCFLHNKQHRGSSAENNISPG